MILFVHSDMSKIKDFIMWADVEFAMQLELLETRNFATQECAIIDMSNLKALAKIGATEPLFVLCHGSPGDPKTFLDGEKYDWELLGEMIGRELAAAAKSIVLFACYAGDGKVPNRPIDRFAKGLAKNRKGVDVTAYLGATVTNTIGTVTAREQKSGTGLGAVLVIDETKTWYPDQVRLLKSSNPQLQFDSYLSSNSKATPRQKAINAAGRAEAFYAAYSTEFMQKGYYYPVGNKLGQSVHTTS